MSETLTFSEFKKQYFGENVNHRQFIAKCDKQFDNILKDSFSKERRLNIAVQLICAMIPKYQDNGDGYGLSVLNKKNMIKHSFHLADALIKESEKGDNNGKD